MNKKYTFTLILVLAAALLALTTFALAGFGDMASPNYALEDGFVGAVGGQITSTNVLAEETRLEPFGNIGWADTLPGQWLPPEQVLTTSVAHPAAAFDGQGVMHAVWLEENGVGYATMLEGGAWSTPTLVPDTDGAVSVDLAVSPGGNVHLTWLEGTTVYYSFKASGGSWPASAETIPTDANDSRNPRLALDAGGVVHLVWYDAGAGVFRYNHKPRGGEWRDNLLHDGNPVPDEDIPDPGYSNSNAEFDLAIDPFGVLHLTWCDGGSCYHGQKDNRNWNDTPIQLGSGVNLAAPAMSVDAAGQTHIVWASRRITDTGGSVTYCAFDGSGCAETQLWAENRETDAPAIAIDAAGQVHVVWHEGAPNGEIYYPRPDGEGAWRSPARLQHNMLGSHNPDLLLGPSGALHLLWGNQSLSRAGLYYMHTEPASWSVSPDELQVGDTSLISVTGHGFNAPISLGLNGDTLSATILSSSTLVFNAPSTLPGGWHDLSLTRSDGASNVIPRALWVNAPPEALILEEAIPTPYKAAFGVTIDPAGNTWFIEADSGAVPEGGASPTKLYRIPYGQQLKIEVVLDGGQKPSALVADTLGYIWFYDPNTNQIHQLDPLSDPGHFLIPVTIAVPTPNAGVTAMAVDPKSNDIWFVEGNIGQIGFINFETGAITDSLHVYDAGDFPTGLAVDRSGDVWFTLANSSRIGRYDVSLGVVLEYRTPTDNAYPTGVTVDPYNQIWFTEYEAGKIGRGDPALMSQNTANGITEYDIPTPDSRPYGIVADIGPDVGLGGRIWFTEKYANQIGSWRADSLAPVTLFADDFSGGDGAWTVDSGSWTIVSESYQGSDSGDFHAHGPTPSWQNYTLQAQVKLLNGGSAGLSFRENGSDDHYRAEIGLDDDGYGFARLGRVMTGALTALARSNADIILDQFYTLRLEVNDNVLRFYLDDQLVALVEDDTFAGGRIGLHGYNATAQFDDLSLTRYFYSSAGHFDEYLIPTEGSRPQEIAVRYDGGDVWFTERGTHKVGGLIRQADGSPARLQYTLVASGTWGDDPNQAYKLPWYAVHQDIILINPFSNTEKPAGLLDPNWESTERAAAFTLDGITYRDNGPNDKNEDPFAIIGMQSAVWHSDNILYAVQQPVRPPRAYIKVIHPPLVQDDPDDPVSGSGGGVSRNGSPITGKEWRSSRESNLISNDRDSFGPIKLDEGTHQLCYRVGVTDTEISGTVWSPEACEGYRVNMRPIARFELAGHGVQDDGALYDVTNETLTLDGRGSYDPDGEVVAWKWEIDDAPISCSNPKCNINNLGIGQHKITLMVQDNDTAWSELTASGATGQPHNFPDNKAVETTRVPIIIVHGYSFMDIEAWKKVEDMAEYFAAHNEGYEYHNYPTIRGNVFLSNYAFNMIPNGNLIGYSAVLAAEIEFVRQVTGADQVDIVALSAGGHISRWYTRFIASGQVRKLIMVGTPNHGQDSSVWLRGISRALDFLTGGIFNITNITSWLTGEGAGMMEPQSQYLRTQNGNDKVFVTDEGPDDELAPDVEHHLFYGNSGDVASRGRWVLKIGDITIVDVWWPEFHTGDGDPPIIWLVPEGSAKLDNVPSYGYPVVHGELENDTQIRDKILQILTGSSRQPTATEPAPAVAKSGTPIYWTSPVQASLTSSEVYRYPVVVDSTTTQAHFKVALTGADVSVTLQAPDGRIIHADEARQQASITLLRNSAATHNTLEYVVAQPQAGTWHILIANETQGATPQPFHATAMMETSVGLAVGVDKQAYDSGEPFQIFAVARDVMSDTAPITLEDGLIIARVEHPDNQVAAMWLYDNGTHGDLVSGDGIFSNIYTDTAQTGAYNVSVAGQFSYNGESILRKASSRTEVVADIKLALQPGRIGEGRAAAAFGLTSATPRANEATELVAHIQNSGRDDAHNVLVHFYNGDPAQGGVFIGETRVDIPAKQTVAARLPWKAEQGVNDLRVAVDPYNFLMLRVEGGFEGALNARMATSVRAIVEDTTAPTADPGPAILIPYSTTVRFDGLNSTDNVGVVTYTWQIDLGLVDGVVTLDGPLPVLTGGISPSGVYSVTLTVYDAAGNSNSADVALEVTDTPLLELPEIATYGGAQAGTFSSLRALTEQQQSDSIIVNEDEAVQFVASADSGDFGFSSYNCEWTVDNDNHPNQKDLFGCRPTLAEGYRQPGTYQVQLQVSDMWGNGRGAVPVYRAITVTVRDTTPPIVELPGVNEDYWHFEAQLTITGTVTDNVKVASVLVNGLPVSTTAEGVFTHTLTLEEGENALDVVVADEAGNTSVVTRSARYTAMDHFEVDISPAGIIAGQPFSASITAQYANDATFPYTGLVRLDDTSGLLLPPQIEMTNGQWTGDLTLYAVQPVTVTVSARNRYGEQAVSQVSPGEFDRVVVWPSPVALQAEQTQQFTATLYDAYNNAVSGSPIITWSLVNGYGEVDPISGVYTAGQQTAYTATIQAEVSLDGRSRTGYAIVTVQSTGENAIYLPIVLKD